MARAARVVAAIDVGAGTGAAVGLFETGRGPLDGAELHVPAEPRILNETLVPVASYCGAPAPMADAVAAAVRGLLRDARGAAGGALAAIGIACPGLFKSDGTTISAANLGFLAGASLPALLGERLGAPAAVANDADAGGLAEWAVAREELLYWVLGGGWGGAWVSADGRVMFPATDWDGRDESLHPTNEPGFAAPLSKEALGRILADEGSSLARLEAVLREDLGERALAGPGARPEFLRAEAVVSGPGRWRVFKAILGDAEEADLSDAERRALASSATAGAVITALGERGLDAAVRTDRIFGRALAEAGCGVIEAAERDGCSRGAPVCIAGGPARALHLFGPDLREGLRRRGHANAIRMSRLEEGGRNANLLGAAVLAAGLAGEG